MNNQMSADTNKVSKAVIINSEGKVLLLQPSSKEKMHLPGGHLQQGENYLQGLMREVFEETSLKVTAYIVIDAAPGFHLWLCRCNGSNVRLSNEHSSYKWADFDEALTKYKITKETKRDIVIALRALPKYANWFKVKKKPQPTKKIKTKAVEQADE
jgi:8-oxo-dGTP pyrophosphatase MutT (NUDIX family)